MSTKHSKAAARFIANRKQEAWHDETLWMVRAKRDKMSHSIPEWERLRELASDIKLYSNSHLDTLLEELPTAPLSIGRKMRRNITPSCRKSSANTMPIRLLRANPC